MTCSSPELVKRVRDSLGEDNVSRVVAYHLDQVLKSHQEPIKLWRTTADLPSDRTVSYNDIDKIKKLEPLYVTNCHNGQRKLVMSVLEFLGDASRAKKVAHKDVLVVYAGASSLATVIAANIFPDLQFAIFDPDPNIISLLPRFDDKQIINSNADKIDYKRRLLIFTKEAGWFTDDTAKTMLKTVLPLCGRKYIWFISDIRADTSETAIINDMKNQARWTLLINADAYMFKFRVPYDGNLFPQYDNVDYMTTATAMLKRTSTANKKPSEIEYLDGQLHLQLYGQRRTTEVRLIGFVSDNGHYRTRLYDVDDHEARMAIFNICYRSHASFAYWNSASQWPHTTYDSLSEYYILLLCLRAKNVKVQNDTAQIVKNINELVSKHVKKTELTCPVLSAIKEKGRHTDEAVRHILKCAKAVQSKLAPEDLKKLDALRKQYKISSGGI
jgi:hypothetical protein